MTTTTPKPRRRRKRGSKKNHYFTQEHEDAIIRYTQTNCSRERTDLYKKYVEKLIKEGRAYYAFDTNEDLINERRKEEEKGSVFFYGHHNRLTLKNSLSLTKSKVSDLIKNKVPHVIRLLISTDKNILCNDLLRVNINFDSSVLEDKILVKSDGIPISVIDNVDDKANTVS